MVDQDQTPYDKENHKIRFDNFIKKRNKERSKVFTKKNTNESLKRSKIIGNTSLLSLNVKSPKKEIFRWFITMKVILTLKLIQSLIKKQSEILLPKPRMFLTHCVRFTMKIGAMLEGK